MPERSELPLLLKSPSIDKILDVGTKHISFEDSKRLEEDAQRTDVRNPGKPTLIVYQYDCGFFVYVNIDPDEPLDEESLRSTYSGALVRLIALAKAHDCRFLRLDADGTDHAGELEVFDW